MSAWRVNHRLYLRVLGIFFVLSLMYLSLRSYPVSALECESIFETLQIKPEFLKPDVDKVEEQMSRSKQSFLDSLIDVRYHAKDTGIEVDGKKLLLADFVVVSKIEGQDFLDQHRDDKYSFVVNLSSLLLDRPKSFFTMADSIVMSKTLPEAVLNSLQLILMCKESDLVKGIGVEYYALMKKLFYLTQNSSKFQKTNIIKETLFEYKKDFVDGYVESVKRYIRVTSKQILDLLKFEPRALNIIDLKLAYISTLSRVTGVYIPLMSDYYSSASDVEQNFSETNQNKDYVQIMSYIVDFYTKTKSDYYKMKLFHPDEKINGFIQESIGMYAKASMQFYSDPDLYIGSIQQQKIKYVVLSPFESFLPANLELYFARKIIDIKALDYSGVFIYLLQQKKKTLFGNTSQDNSDRVSTGGYVFKIGSSTDSSNFALLEGIDILYPAFTTYSQYAQDSDSFIKEFRRFMKLLYDNRSLKVI